MLPQKKMLSLWQLWALEARAQRSRVRSESELSPQRVQKSAPPSTGGLPTEV